MADIDVFENDASVRVVVTSNGQTLFDFDFLAYDASSVFARYEASDGEVYELTLNTDYTVGNLSQENGGYIQLIGTWAGASAIGEEIVIYRDTRIERLFDYQNAGDFRAETINRELDTMVMIDQEARRDIDRSFKVPLGSAIPAPFGITIGADHTIPVWLGGSLVPGPTVTEVSNAETYSIEAKAARDAVLAALGAVVSPMATVALAQAHNPDVSPAYYEVSFYDANFVPGSGGLYIKRVGMPAHPLRFQNAKGDWYEIDEQSIDPAMIGARYDGATDDRGALALADQAAVARGALLRVGGVMRIASAITIASSIMVVGSGRLKPDNNIIVTLGARVFAPAVFIFDRTAGGAIQFAKGAGEVWVEWWGARAEPAGRTDNNVPIQHAIDACGSFLSIGDMGAAPNADGNGGVVRFASSNIYLVSGRIHLRNRTILRGNGGYGPEIKLNVATWNGDTEMVLSQNGTASQFWCRLEDMILNAEGLASLDRVVYAPAWQESCGLRDVLIRNFYNTGLLVDSFYGGSVGFVLKGVQLFPFSAPGTFVRGIDINSPSSVARQAIVMEDISFAGITDAAPPGLNMVGVRATGRVDLICARVFVEGYDFGVLLRTGASLFGDLHGPGNPSVTSVIDANNDFTGRIDCHVTKGSASFLMRSYVAGHSDLYAIEPYSRTIVYPATGGEVFAAGRVTAADTVPVVTGYGLASVVRTGTGLLQLMFDLNTFSPGNADDYRVEIIPESISPRYCYVDAAGTTNVQIQFKDPATGAVADLDYFDFRILAKPGF